MICESLSTTEDRILQRIRGEFVEMPGLRLTCQQARRLWALDEQTCLSLLEFLVETKFLCRLGDGRYSRFTDGPFERSLFRMAGAADSTSSNVPAVLTSCDDGGWL
jgi:hypothetical protein